jgi:cysteine synthase A
MNPATETFLPPPTVRAGAAGTVGHTPLIRLRRLSEALGSEILGKAEFLNPGGSVKDRAALGIIEDGEARGALRPGGTIVEGTAGNTGIGLALLGNARGYRTIIIIPDDQSPEKYDLLRAVGAELRLVPRVPYSNPDNYIRQAGRVAAGLPGGFWANQFDNVANAEIHYRTTGPEIWAQTDGRVTVFAAAIGTGGTLSGVSRALKERNPAVHIACADPMGAAMWSWFTHGHTDIDDGDSMAEGIGQGRVTANVEGCRVDEAHRIPDRIMVELVYHLLHEEGLLLGTSSGINLGGLIRAVQRRGPGQVGVTILCDGGQRYLGRLFNPQWLAARDLTPQNWSVDRILAEIAALPQAPS